MPLPNLNIEPLSSKTLAACAAIARHAPDPWSAATLEKTLTDPNRLCLVALTIRGAPAAFASFLLVEDTADLEMVVVEPTRRGEGVGGTLLTQSLALLKKQGVTRCLLELRASNTTALKLYQSLGFAVLAKRPGMYQSPSEDGLLMAKNL